MSLLAHLNRHDDKSLQSTLHRIQAEVHAAFGTILAESIQLETRSHRPLASIIREAQAMTNMRQADALRHEKLHAQAVKLARSILEHMTGLIGREQNGSRFIDHERAVRRLREDTLQVCEGMHSMRPPGSLNDLLSLRRVDR